MATIISLADRMEKRPGSRAATSDSCVTDAPAKILIFDGVWHERIEDEAHVASRKIAHVR